MDLPLFVDDPSKRRRQINLGGTSSAMASAAILQEARSRRSQRMDEKRRQESALRIQEWWRGERQCRAVKRQLLQVFEADVTSTTGLRCLVLIGRDEQALAHWSLAMLAGGKERLLQMLSDPSWSVLLRRTTFLLLQSVSDAPQSQYAPVHGKVLEIVLSQQSENLSPPAREARRSILSYLLSHGYYSLLGSAISQLPPSSKSTSDALPNIVTLLITPFSTFTADGTSYKLALEDLLSYVLTVSLLPNRILPSLTSLASNFPISSLHLIDVDRVSENASTLESKIHLLSNLSLFAPPRYSVLQAPALDTYLKLGAALMSALPPRALEPPQNLDVKQSQHWEGEDSDEESTTQVSIVNAFEPKIVLPVLDRRTLTRLETIPSSSHINSLLSATKNYPSTRSSLSAWCVSLCNAWPTRRDKILSAVIIYGGGGLVRELYRSYVRPAPLGKDVDAVSLMDTSNAAHWPHLLFLVELYTQALVTMGDDEFFSTNSTTGSPRNPLTLDELTSFSRQLLNIAFTLYWREDQTNVQVGGVPGMKNLKWEGVREKVTKCLQAIHARDSRKPFTPPGHWLVASQLDMGPFIDAAVFEDRQLSQPAGSKPLTIRQVASISPRLGILNNIPFAIPFEVRVSIFRHFIANDRAQRGYSFGMFDRRDMTRVTVRRGMIAQDGFDRLGEVDLKSPIAITFIDQFGQEEAGIDGGGVFKEFLTSLCKEVFDTDRGLWLATKNNELYPNPHSYATEAHSLNWYRFIGRILGKALYEGILVDVAFAGFFLAKWLGKQSFLDDLASLDPELYQGLIFLKHYTGNPEDLSLNFAVAIDDFGVTRSIPLIPNGNEIPVTRENRLQYIFLVSHYRLNKQIKLQCDAFFEGLSEMIDPKWLRMFNQQELQILLGGVNSPIDLDDLRQYTNYGGLYNNHEPTIEAFWRVVNAFNQEQRRGLLRFVTSCSRPPLLGFKELVPNFAIRDAGSDENRLPTASTCVNLLKLPRYTNQRVLKEKLIQAITSNAGFDLS